MVKPSELSTTEAEGLGCVRRIKPVGVEKANRTAMPWVFEGRERGGESRRVEGATDDDQLAKDFETPLQSSRGGRLIDAKPLAGRTLSRPLEPNHSHDLPFSHKWYSLDRRMERLPLDPPFDVGEGFEVLPGGPRLKRLGDPLLRLKLKRASRFGSPLSGLPLGSAVGAPREPSTICNRLYDGPLDA
jgi:hypothetical protein